MFVPRHHFTRPGQKPFFTAEIDQSNTIAQKLRYSYLPRSSRVEIYDHKSLIGLGTPNGGINVEPTYFGRSSGANEYIEHTGPVFTAGNFTVIARARWTATLDSTRSFALLSDTDSTNYGTHGVLCNIRERADDSNIFFRVGNGSTLEGVSGTYSGVASGDWHTYAFVYEVGKATTCYVDGVLIASGDTATGLSESSLGRLRSGFYYNTLEQYGCHGDVEFVHYFQEALSDAEITDISRDPYQIFKPLSSSALFAGAALVYLRPNADDTDGNWLNEAGSNINLYASIDETTASDADYIRSANSPAADICRVALSDPANGIDLSSDHTIKYRYNKAVDGQQIDLTVRLKQSTTTIATWAHTNISTTIADATQTLSAGEVSSITDYTALILEFEANAP